MSDSRLHEALDRAAELSSEPFGGSWVAGWAEAVKALEHATILAHERGDWAVENSSIITDAITKFIKAMLGENVKGIAGYIRTRPSSNIKGKR